MFQEALQIMAFALRVKICPSGLESLWGGFQKYVSFWGLLMKDDSILGFRR